MNVNHLWLVDLAGSEKGETETAMMSLSALKEVISAVYSKEREVPYSNSKLTHLLKDTLSENCKTLFFVMVSPDNIEETRRSLAFASSIGRINLARFSSESVFANMRFRYGKRLGSFKIDPSFNPTAPQNPMGYMYDGIVTMASQRLFRGMEFAVYQSPSLDRTCATIATKTQNGFAWAALKCIGESSSYGVRKSYNGVSGAYAIARICIPISLAGLCALAEHFYGEHKKKSEQSISDGKLKHALANAEKEIHKKLVSPVSVEVGKLEVTVAKVSERLATVEKMVRSALKGKD
ncbi:uncharacterized protein LOC111831478 [Capsella rubella]|uniref:uncharacterized protein LOC111831478 n=1 Tax=Capsella rubella TaxID=81985 RepID=UPI000CD5A489|nr:uncharacterized protein LOC111831478 [Capsella rubella]XP_023641553.1 uncharacterized protein LOC111831478 [Capsella rubella]